jgi:bifunctional non-homologous end joining protein LigD
MKPAFITLYYREGSSDKVYQASLVDVGGLFEIHFAYGRRGNALTTGKKTLRPEPYSVALRIYERLVAEKLGKGYREMDETIVSSHSVAVPESTGILPQLLNPAVEDEVEDLLSDDRFLMQEKKDGKRLILQKDGSTITGINRRGIACGLPQNIVKDALALPGDWLIDGELVGETFHAFDLLEHDGSYRAKALRVRLVALFNLIASGQAPAIQLVASYTGEAVKRRFLERSREDNLEGVVFKDMQAPYIPGRPNSGGAQRKFKFVETASVVVTSLNGKRSVKIGVLDGERMIACGNVTIPVGSNIPGIGDIVEVRYLYAFRESGSLFQPVYLDVVRYDLELKDCSVNQLKWKKAEELVAA